MKAGKFEISREYIMENQEEVFQIFSALKIVPINIQAEIIPDVLTYTAIGDRFEEVNDGDVVPKYTIIAHKKDGSIDKVDLEKQEEK